MPTSFPGGLDSLPRPTSTTEQDDAGFELDVVIDNISDAIEALEAKVGIDASAVTTSHDYKLGRLLGSGAYSARPASGPVGSRYIVSSGISASSSHLGGAASALPVELTYNGTQWIARNQVIATYLGNSLINNTAAEQTLLSASCPAAFMNEGSIFRMKAWGMVNHRNVVENFAWRSYIGSTLSINMSIATTNTARTNQPWSFEVDCYIDSAGNFRMAGVNNHMLNGVAATNLNIDTANIAVPAGDPKTISLRTLMPVANASNGIELYGADIIAIQMFPEA